MKRAGKLCFVLLLTLSITTGCWNLREPNQLAFVVGSGLDLTKDGKLEVVAVIATPGGSTGGSFSGGSGGDSGGGKKQGSTVLSATGKNISDAATNLQAKLSRTVFPGHREIVLIGQRMAEHGIGNLLDGFFRNPQAEMRSRLYVVKDGQAKDVLSIESFTDPFITTTLLNSQKALGLKHYYLRDFVSDALSKGTHPLLPAFSLTAEKHYVYTGAGIFKKDDELKLIGFLNTKETFYTNWITDRQSGYFITSAVTQGKGNISIDLTSLNRRIRVRIVDKQVQIDVHLTGKGIIIENNTNLDPSKPKDLQLIEDELSQTTQKSIQQLIKKVQKQYKTDIFRFGESVHQQYPHQWKTLNPNWNETFAQLHVSVKVDFHCNPGHANSSIMGMP